MKYVNKTVNGVLYIALTGAIGLGFGFVTGALFDSDIPFVGRVIIGILALTAFLLGYASEGGGETDDTDEEDEDVAA